MAAVRMTTGSQFRAAWPMEPPVSSPGAFTVAEGTCTRAARFLASRWFRLRKQGDAPMKIVKVAAAAALLACGATLALAQTQNYSSNKNHAVRLAQQGVARCS